MKKRTIIIISLIILMLAVGAVVVYQATRKKPQAPNFIMEKDWHLSAGDQKIYEDRITAIMLKLSTATEDAIKFDLYSQLGFAEYGLGNLEASKGYFEQAIRISSDQYGVHLGLFQTLVEMQDNQGAEDSIKQAISIKPQDPDFWRKYIQLEIDRFHAADDQINVLFEEALNKTQSHIDVVTFYATWLEKVGNLHRAKELWQAAIEINPDKKAIYQQEIKRLE